MIELLQPAPMWEQQLPTGIREHAYDVFKDNLDGLYYPDMIVLPLTQEGAERREWLVNYQYKEGKLIHQRVQNWYIC
jgi:hypothetical protein